MSSRFLASYWGIEPYIELGKYIQSNLLEQRFHRGDRFDGSSLASESDTLQSNSYVGIGVTSSSVKGIRTYKRIS